MNFLRMPLDPNPIHEAHSAWSYISLSQLFKKGELVELFSESTSKLRSELQLRSLWILQFVSAPATKLFKVDRVNKT